MLESVEKAAKCALRGLREPSLWTRGDPCGVVDSLPRAVYPSRAARIDLCQRSTMKLASPVASVALSATC